MKQNWVSNAAEELRRLRGKRAGWGYRPGGTLSVEPTVLSSLAIMTEHRDGQNVEAVDAAKWLTSLQKADGSVGVSENLPDIAWPTPYAILLWASLNEYPGQRKKAAEWLLHEQGKTFQGDSEGVMLHDTTIPGWPWVSESFSWIEPTALAILALRREGLGDNVRAREGIRLLKDRAIPGGGWNYGNSVVFGKELLPQPGPTGLALLAMAQREREDGIVERACDYLLRVLPAVRSPLSLCWGLLGLEAWGRVPPDSSSWLDEAYIRLQAGSWNRIVELAFLVLGSSVTALRFLGLSNEQT